MCHQIGLFIREREKRFVIEAARVKIIQDSVHKLILTQ